MGRAEGVGSKVGVAVVCEEGEAARGGECGGCGCLKREKVE